MAELINITDNSDSRNDNNNQKVKPQNLSQLSAEELVMIATTLALSLTRCRTNCEIRTLINLVNLLQENLVAILAQRNVCSDGIEEVLL